MRGHLKWQDRHPGHILDVDDGHDCVDGDDRHDGADEC